MKLKQVVNGLNRQHNDNEFKLTELAAKRSADKSRDAVVAMFVNHHNWKDFTPGRVVLFEALPVGWPLSNMAERLNCSVDELRIISHYNSLTKKWRSVIPTDCPACGTANEYLCEDGFPFSCYNCDYEFDDYEVFGSKIV